MLKLISCEICGWLTTRGREFIWRDGVRMDKNCAEFIDLGHEHHIRWFDEAKAKAISPSR